MFAAPPPDPAAMAMVMADAPPARPAVLRTAADPPGSPGTPASRRTPIAGADPLSAAGQGRTFADLARRSAGGSGFADPTAVELKAAPWATADPLARLDKDRPWEAFRLAADRPTVRAVRRTSCWGPACRAVADGHLGRTGRRG
ncbi:MAG: hypothetical protein U0871_00365 [Gemmataceae bacterium]